MPAITIRDVPEDVRDELASRAALAGQSLQEFLRAYLIATASRPTQSEVIKRARERVQRLGSKATTASILAAKGADRR